MSKEQSKYRQKHNDRLPIDIPELKFLTDFHCRMKTARKAVFALVSLPKRDSEVSKEVVAVQI